MMNIAIKNNPKYKHFNVDIRNYQSLEKIFKIYIIIKQNNQIVCG